MNDYVMGSPYYHDDLDIEVDCVKKVSKNSIPIYKLAKYLNVNVENLVGYLIVNSLVTKDYELTNISKTLKLLEVEEIITTIEDIGISQITKKLYVTRKGVKVITDMVNRDGGI